MITKLIAKTYFNKNNKNLEPVSQKMLRQGRTVFELICSVTEGTGQSNRKQAGLCIFIYCGTSHIINIYLITRF